MCLSPNEAAVVALADPFSGCKVSERSSTVLPNEEWRLKLAADEVLPGFSALNAQINGVGPDRSPDGTVKEMDVLEAFENEAVVKRDA
jgi:hypothetical protein